MYTVTQVAEKLDVSTRTVRDLIYSGELEAYQYTENGTYKIPKESLERFLEKSKVVITEQKGSII